MKKLIQQSDQLAKLDAKVANDHFLYLSKECLSTGRCLRVDAG